MELVRAAALKGYFEVAEELKLDVRRCSEARPVARRCSTIRSRCFRRDRSSACWRKARKPRVASRSACRMAERRELADLGMVSLLIAHQPTLGDALSVLSQYRNRINSNLVLRVEKFDDMVLLREMFALDPPIASRQADDLAIAVLDQICRTVLGTGWQPISISFGYEPPPSSERQVYKRLFYCPVEFGSEFDGILIGAADLDRPNPRSEPALALHARKLVEAMVDPGERNMIEEVEEAILLLMPAGRASIETVADTLGINVRTLQRRLVEEGTSFSAVLNRVRVREVFPPFGASSLSPDRHRSHAGLCFAWRIQSLVR